MQIICNLCLIRTGGYMLKKSSLFAFVFATLFLVSGAYAGGKKDTSRTTAGKEVIAVSIVPEATFVQKVCGDDFDVITMIPPGSSPENYEPTPAQIAQFGKAKLYFTIGVPTEQAHILAQTTKNTKIVDLPDIVAKTYPDRTFEDGGRDPHIWLSPKRVQVIVHTIADEVSILKPETADTYKKNADAYCNDLTNLQNEISDMFNNLNSRKFIVYHPAFGYFSDDFGLDMTALEQEGKDATPQQLMDVIDYAKKNNIKVIFYQSEIDSSQSKSFAEEIGGVTKALSPLSGDYINNLKFMAKTIADAQSK